MKQFNTSNLKKRLSLLFFAAVGAWCPAYAQAPANDNCSGAQAITVSATCTPVSGTTVNATQSATTPDPACGAGDEGWDDDVWYSFTPATGQTAVDISFASVAGEGDLVAQVYTSGNNTCSGTFGLLACSDDDGGDGLPQLLSLAVTPGSTYFVRVFSYSSSVGTTGTSEFTICIQEAAVPPPPAPANNDCSGAVALSVSPTTTCAGTTTGTTFGATQSNEAPPSTNASGTNDDVWYSFTATAASHIITLDGITGGTTDMAMAVYSGTCGALTFLDYSDPEEMNINNLTPNQTYYLRVWTYSSGSANAAFNVCITTPPPAPSCATNITPANAATGVTIYPTPPVLTWHSVPGAENYTLYLGTSAANATNTDNTSDTSLQVAGLDFNTTYYWYVVPENETGPATGCESNATSFTTEAAPPAPANDNCANAIALTMNSGFPTVTTMGTTIAATAESGFTTPDCAGDDSVDVWYTVTVPASGNVTIQSSAVNEFVTDMVMEVYSGTCGALTLVECNDDGNPDDFPSSAHSRIELTGETPGTVLYVRELPYSNSNRGAFVVYAWDPGVLPAVSPGGNCVPGTAVTIDTSGTNLYRWVPIFDGSGNILAEIYPDGNAMGTISSSVYVNSGAVRQGNGVFYLDRNVTITPATQPASTVKVRMYLLNTELSALEAVDADVTGLSDLNFSKNSDPCQASVNGATEQFAQTNSDAYGANGGFIEFETPSFSTLYARSGTTIPLPVELKSISAANAGNRNRVDWSTAKEDRGEYFELERSADGKKFSFLSRIEAKGMAADYTYWDNTPVAGVNYYRLRITNNEGKKIYSPVVTATMNSKGSFSLLAIPNPVHNTLKISMSNGAGQGTFTLTDVTGRPVRTIPVTAAEVLIDMNDLAPGIYLVKYSDAQREETIKVNKL